jgi:hypothetical protein
MSLFGFNRPSGVSWSVSASGPGATGQAIISPVGAGGTFNLDDGRPDTTARFQWPTGASQTTSTIMKIRADWTTPQFEPRIIGISNSSLPAGLKVQVAFRRAADTLGTYPWNPTIYNNGQRITALPRGERVCWIFLPAGSAGSTILGVEWQLFNDVNGSVGNSAGLGLFNHGEMVIAPGVDMDIKAGWSLRPFDPTMDSYDVYSNPLPDPGCPYRIFSFSFPVDDQKIYFGDASNPTAIDYEELLAFLDRGQFGVYAPRYLNAAGAFDAQAAQRLTFIGRMKTLPSFDQASGSWFQNQSGAVVQESPIPT